MYIPAISKAILGLEVNLWKFKLLVVREVRIRKSWSISSLVVSLLSLKYLRLLLGASFNSKAIWDG